MHRAIRTRLGRQWESSKDGPGWPRFGTSLAHSFRNYEANTIERSSGIQIRGSRVDYVLRHCNSGHGRSNTIFVLLGCLWQVQGSFHSGNGAPVYTAVGSAWKKAHSRAMWVVMQR